MKATTQRDILREDLACSAGLLGVGAFYSALRSARIGVFVGTLTGLDSVGCDYMKTAFTVCAFLFALMTASAAEEVGDESARMTDHDYRQNLRNDLATVREQTLDCFARALVIASERSEFYRGSALFGNCHLSAANYVAYIQRLELFSYAETGEEIFIWSVRQGNKLLIELAEEQKQAFKTLTELKERWND